MKALMPLMRRFSIRFRMRSAIAVVLALFGVVGMAGWFGGKELARLNESFMHHSIQEMRDFAQLRESLAQMRLHERNLLIDQDDTSALASDREKWNAEVQHFKAGLNALLEGEEDEDNVLARQALPLMDAYASDTQAVLAHLQDGSLKGAHNADRELAASKDKVARVESLVVDIGKILDREVNEAQQAFGREMTFTAWAFFSALALVIVVVVPLTLLNSASITRPIAHARQIAMAIAEGDLTQEIIRGGDDEVADLMHALEQMQAGLTQLVGQVRTASQNIHVSSSEVASGNADLSQRTEQAAGNLQQTASSMEQLTGSVRHSAENATQASTLAGEASGVAQRGGEVVRQVVSTMDEINTASHRIADIIGVIDGIAFQTNILALNAAVEAARAGEQGRGFAVVASEVRALAGRSGEAAREIKGLIGASVDKVDTGARLVREAGETMNEIVASVQRVNDIIHEISNAATEQSHGIEQVNTAVVGLDHLTQQNAALVEQNSAAAEHLRGQAQNLSNVVGSFRLAS